MQTNMLSDTSFMFRLRVRDCCECFVYKYTHELNVQLTKNVVPTNFEFIVHSASAYICKQNTNLTVPNTFNIRFEFTARVRKQKPYAFAHKIK